MGGEPGASRLAPASQPRLLDRNHSNAEGDWRWQWVFPQQRSWRNPGLESRDYITLMSPCGARWTRSRQGIILINIGRRPSEAKTRKALRADWLEGSSGQDHRRMRLSAGLPGESCWSADSLSAAWARLT
jgi:hypothetical protein